MSSQVINQNNADQVQQLTGWGKGVINRIGFTPDHRLTLVDTPFGLYLYNTETLEVVNFLEAAGSYRYSPDGGLLLVTYAHKPTIEILDLPAGEVVATLEYDSEQQDVLEEMMGFGWFSPVRGMTFSPDGQLLAVSYFDNQIVIWQVGTWEEQMRLSSHLAPSASGMAFSSDMAYLLTSSGTVGIWRLSDGKLLSRLPNLGYISSEPFSPDGSMYATSYEGGYAVYSFPGSGLLYRHKFGGFAPNVRFSHDKNYLIVNGQVRRLADGTRLPKEKEEAYLFPEGRENQPTPIPTPELNEETFEKIGHYWGMQGVEFTTEDSILTWGIKDGSVLFWREVISGDKSSVSLESTAVNRAFLSPDQAEFAICLTDNLNLIVIDGTEMVEYAGCKENGYLAYQDENYLARASSTLIDIINLQTGEVEHNLRGHQDKITALAYSPDGRSLASGTSVSRGGAELYLWKLDPYSIWQKWNISSYGINAMDFSPDSELIVIGGGNDVRLYRVQDGWQLKYMKVDGGALVVTFSPDGNLIVAADTGGKIFIWRVPDGELLNVLEGHRGSVVDLDFSANGRNIISVSSDGTVRLWGIP